MLNYEMFDDAEPQTNIDELIVLNATNFNGFEREETMEAITSLSLTTFPYFSVIENFDNDFYVCSVDVEAIGEDGSVYSVETFAGMSGSPVFKIYIQTLELKWIGLDC